MDANLTTIIVALIVSVISPAVLGGITSFFRRREKREDWARQDEVARLLRASTTETDNKLSQLKDVTDGTHTIVNNQRTVLLCINADLRERIARENPNDEEAQLAAQEARDLANTAKRAQWANSQS